MMDHTSRPPQTTEFGAKTATLVMGEGGAWCTGSDMPPVYCSLDLKAPPPMILEELQGWTTPPGLLRQFNVWC